MKHQILRTLVLAVVLATAVLAGGWFGRVVPFSEQWPIFEALRTTAAIIFAVIGAWMAIIYPDRLKLSLRDPEKKVNGEPTGMGKLLTPVVNSTVILCVILVVGAVAPILRRHAIPVDVMTLRGMSYGLLVGLTLWQLWTVVLTLVPASDIKTYVDHEDGRTRVLKGAIKLSGGAPGPD